MIRVLHVLTDSNIGGAGHHLLALLENFNKEQFCVEVVLPTNALLAPEFEKRGIAYTELPHLAEQSFSWKAVKVLREKMEQFKPNIVHTHAALSGRVAARRYGKCKIVHTRHSVFEPSDRQKRFPVKQLSGSINNYLSDAIIAVSPAAKDNLLALSVAENKIHVIFNGMPPAKQFSLEEKLALRKKYGIDENAFVVAQIARLTDVKGQHDVLDAFGGKENVTVLMAGDGDIREQLEERIAKENFSNVHLLGFIKEVEEIFAIMDVQISASYGTEATSLALVQGMSVGKPAVVTDYGGNPYVISNGENGFVVPTRNYMALREAVMKLQRNSGNDENNKLMEQLSANSLVHYEKNFTVSKMVALTEELYKKVLV